jgi:hypothetical protein
VCVHACSVCVHGGVYVVCVHACECLCGVFCGARACGVHASVWCFVCMWCVWVVRVCGVCLHACGVCLCVVWRVVFCGVCVVCVFLKMKEHLASK